jgi:hypothetical protein
MHPNESRINAFYDAFARLDPDGMAACYAEDVMFDDEAFSLRGKAETMAMWRMLCEGARERSADVWQVRWSEVSGDEYQGGARWEATYRFGPGKRLVRNRIEARFGFNDEGLIAVHRDRFDFWRWSRQALGLPGLLLGWSPSLRRKVRQQAGRRLAQWVNSKEHTT